MGRFSGFRLRIFARSPQCREKAKLACLSLLVGVALMASPGCSNKPEEESKIQNPESKSEPVPNVAKPAPAAVHPSVKQPPPKPTIPQVSLSKDLQATCRVLVGDKMPTGELRDSDGKPQSLAKLFGKKATVVFFWIAGNAYSMGEVEDQGDDIASAYAAKGVQVIGINQGDSAEKVRAALKESGVKYPILLDAGGAYFHKVATEKLLRTYLLDAQGKILWFDTEYSRATRRDLLQAIDAALSK